MAWWMLANLLNTVRNKENIGTSMIGGATGGKEGGALGAVGGKGQNVPLGKKYKLGPVQKGFNRAIAGDMMRQNKSTAMSLMGKPKVMDGAFGTQGRVSTQTPDLRPHPGDKPLLPTGRPPSAESTQPGFRDQLWGSLTQEPQQGAFGPNTTGLKPRPSAFSNIMKGAGRGALAGATMVGDYAMRGAPSRWIQMQHGQEQDKESRKLQIAQMIQDSGSQELQDKLTKARTKYTKAQAGGTATAPPPYWEISPEEWSVYSQEDKDAIIRAKQMGMPYEDLMKGVVR